MKETRREKVADGVSPAAASPAFGSRITSRSAAYERARGAGAGSMRTGWESTEPVPVLGAAFCPNPTDNERVPHTARLCLWVNVCVASVCVNPSEGARARIGWWTVLVHRVQP